MDVHVQENAADTAEGKNLIHVVTKTPGSNALVDAMFEHIWGRKRERDWSIDLWSDEFTLQDVVLSLYLSVHLSTLTCFPC